MALWHIITLIAIVLVLALRTIDVRLGDKEKLSEIRKKLQKTREMSTEERKRFIVEATTEMNKILLRRMVISFALLIPLWWVYHLGEIDTPLGTMAALWWYIISMVIAKGGVWLGGAIQEKVKAGKG